jgi:dTDP-4-amino-4,6-dideoxy-D-galactose acyltransferase
VIKPLPWDTEFFGFPIGKVDLPPLSLGGPDGIGGEGEFRLELNQFRCVYWLAELEDESPAAYGFDRIDERVTLARGEEKGTGTFLIDHPITSERQPPIKKVPVPFFDIRHLKYSYLTALRPTLRSAHTDSRFFTDSRFPRDRSELLYERWLERDLAHLPDSCWTVFIDGRPAGYLTLTVNDQHSSIGLLGVLEQYRGRGFAKALIAQALRYSAERGLACSVVTQGRNTAAINVYRKAGFEVVSRKAWWHRWIESL